MIRKFKMCFKVVCHFGMRMSVWFWCDIRVCVKAVTETDSAESTEITELPGPNLRKMANNYDFPIPVFSSITG